MERRTKSLPGESERFQLADRKVVLSRLAHSWKESLAVLPVVSAVSALAAKAGRHSVAPRPPAPHRNHCLPDMELHCTLHTAAAAPNTLC